MKSTHVRKISARLERVRGALPLGSVDALARTLALANGGGPRLPWRGRAYDLNRLVDVDVRDLIGAVNDAQADLRSLRRRVSILAGMWEDEGDGAHAAALRAALGPVPVASVQFEPATDRVAAAERILRGRGLDWSALPVSRACPPCEECGEPPRLYHGTAILRHAETCTVPATEQAAASGGNS